MLFSVQPKKKLNRRNLWFERLMATAATVNFGLVLFNLSYVPWRDFYLQHFPALTQLYDPVKGIEPYRETTAYLQTVDQLQQQVSQTGLNSPQAQALLQELRQQSIDMIQENWFAEANKSGTLERIKDRMRRKIYGNKSYRTQSAKQAFATFWSQRYLTTHGWLRQIAFFDIEIRPLIQTNYYRHIGENGELVDTFLWKIDIWFILLFGVEFLGRTFYISRTHTRVSWLDAMLWRWYDVFLLLPFWRFLRVIPVTVRLHQARLLDLGRVQKQVNESLVASIAAELTQVIVVRVIDQVQDSIAQGELTRWLRQPQKQHLLQLNQVNEAQEIVDLLIHLVVYQVLPKVQPDLEAIVQHNLVSLLGQLPLYSNFQKLPGMEQLPMQLSAQLATLITQNIYSALVAGIEDPVGAKLSSRLVQHFSEALGSEVRKKQTSQEIQVLLLSLLEEIKFNYVKRLGEEDVEKTLEETRRLRSQAVN